MGRALALLLVLAGCWSGQTPTEPRAPRASEQTPWPTTEVPAGSGRLKIICEPPAYIFVDDVDTGQTTPTAIVVTAQRHEVKLYRSLEDKTDFKSVVVEVVSGSEETIRESFEQAPAH